MASFIWQDGGAVMTEGPAVMANDRGLTLGDALFETLPAFAGRPFRLEAHLHRLMEGARALHLDVDETVCRALVDAALGHHRGEDVVLRLEVTRGASGRGLHIVPGAAPCHFLLTAPWSPSLLEGAPSLTVSSIRRNETSPSSRHKTANYLDNILALEGARRAGFDDALMINSSGHVACTTTANIFAMRGSELLTPRLEDGVLGGIIRAIILEDAPACGLQPVEQSLTAEDLKAADSLFITNSARLMLPVARLEERLYDLAALPGAYRRLQGWLRGRIEAETGYVLEAYA